MIFRIHNSKYDDYFDVEGDTIEEIRELALSKQKQLGWNSDDCWSEEIKK